jgi:hypothetical protein
MSHGRHLAAADLGQTNARGQTALDYANELELPAMAALLRETASLHSTHSQYADDEL